jgi:ankyrin repeat protein
VDRRAEYEQFRRIDAAFRAGDLEQLRSAVDDPELIPNGPMPLTVGPCLQYAIYHSPIGFIRALLELGADPNADDAGFPSLHAALSSGRADRGARPRADVIEVIELLLAFGADPDQRGINDYTPLHHAAGLGRLDAVRCLLRSGADARLRTRIDDLETACELAESAGHAEIARVLREAERLPPQAKI